MRCREFVFDRLAVKLQIILLNIQKKKLPHAVHDSWKTLQSTLFTRVS